MANERQSTDIFMGDGRGYKTNNDVREQVMINAKKGRTKEQMQGCEDGKKPTSFKKGVVD